MTASNGVRRTWRRPAASSLTLIVAATAMAGEKSRPGPAPAVSQPVPVVTIVGLSVVDPGFGAKNEDVRPSSAMPGTALTLAVTVAPPAGILAISGERKTLEIRGVGGPLEEPEFMLGSDVADDGRGGTIMVRANGLPGPGAATVSARGKLVVRASPDSRTEKVAGVKWESGATFRLAESLITVTKAEVAGDSLRVEIKGPVASLGALKAIRFRPRTGAALTAESRGNGSGGEEAWRSYSFRSKELSGSLEVDLWRDPRDVAVPFQVSTGVGLAPPPAGAAVVARPALAPLASGTASGRLVVDGKALELAHAAAVSGPCDFDKTRESFAIFLTEKPIPAGTLENAATLKAADQVQTGLVITTCREEPLQTYRLLIRHPVDSNLMQIVSLTRNQRWALLGPERVSGTVTSFHRDRPEEIKGHKVQYRVRFNAPVRKRFPLEAPLVLAPGAVKVGPGGGEPGKAYLVQQCAPLPVNPEDPKSVEAFLAKEGKLPTEADLAELSKEAGKPVTRDEALTMLGMALALATAFRPTDCKVLGGAQDGTLAVLQVEATVNDERSIADVYLVKVGAGWKYKKHGTWHPTKTK